MFRLPAALAVSVLAVFLAAPPSARAQERALFESVPGWQVELSSGVAGNRQCVIVRNYVDEDDDDADNSVAFAIENKSLVVVLKYGKWDYDTEAKFTAATSLGGKVVSPKSTWTAKGNQLVGQLSGTLADKAAEAEEISLKGKDWQAAFDLTGAEEAFEAMKRCNAGEAPTARP